MKTLRTWCYFGFHSWVTIGKYSDKEGNCIICKKCGRIG